MRLRSALIPLLVLGTACSSERPASPPAATGAVAAPAGPAAGPEVVPATATEILAAARAPGAGATLVNVWGTWCGPCREEFPDLVRLGRERRDEGLRLLFVSVDFDDQLPQVKRFLATHGVTEPSFLKRGKDMEFIDTLNPDWSGALPATLLFDRDGRLADFWEGKASYDSLTARVGRVLSLPNQRPEASS